jgi:bifunctional non-homologous end joining protein LigD
VKDDGKEKNDKKVSTMNPSSSSSSLSLLYTNFSNLGKVFWPKTTQHQPLTKENLIEYYNKISSHILPHLKNRPLILSRFPNGIDSKHFYQKNWDKETPDYVDKVRVYSKSRDIIINYLVCNNRDTLLWLANLGCIEMHPWISSIKDYEACSQGINQTNPLTVNQDECGLVFPDFIVFDLDSYIHSESEQQIIRNSMTESEYNTRGFKEIIMMAFQIKDLLDELKIKSYVKTSGKAGLHIYVPIESFTYRYNQTRSFAKVIGELLLKRNPQDITMHWDTAQRKGKVFFDYNQNSKGKTTASVFSARPTASATVSMPVRWDKLNNIYPTDFTILNVPEIINRSTYLDTRRDMLYKKQNILNILENLS